MQAKEAYLRGPAMGLSFLQSKCSVTVDGYEVSATYLVEVIAPTLSAMVRKLAVTCNICHSLRAPIRARSNPTRCLRRRRLSNFRSVRSYWRNQRRKGYRLVRGYGASASAAPFPNWFSSGSPGEWSSRLRGGQAGLAWAYRDQNSAIRPSNLWPSSS